MQVLSMSHINSPFKGNIQSYTCKSYLEALFLAYISRPLKGDI